MRSPTTNSEADDVEWRRLSTRVVWVDLVQSVLALIPGLITVLFFDVSFSFTALWPLVAVAALGILGAVGDVVRWTFTRYRVGSHEIECRTGVFVRRQRTIQLDRIRSVDTRAKLRHRIAGLRLVIIGAGQQTGAGESALVLDALTAEQATELRDELLRFGAPNRSTRCTADNNVGDDEAAEDNGQIDRIEVIETFRAWWAIYNVASVWAFIMAGGLIWGAQWFLSMFGFDLIGSVLGAAEWRSFRMPALIALAVLATGIIGAIGMAANYFTTYWNFELARVHVDDKSYLRTRRGLFSTHEVNRDESRVRGASISEPLFWRWINAADTNIISTGLSVWSVEQPTALLPRSPHDVARNATARALGVPSPFEAPLESHPKTARRRRLWWASLIGLAPVAAVLAPVLTGVVPYWALWVALATLPLTMAAGLISYRSLGHTISGEYLVVRSGLLNRTTSALRRDAVSTIAIRQSILQKRLGLCTVSAMTAAGWGIYEALDIEESEGVSFAIQAAPGLLDDLVEAEPKSLMAAR